MKTLYDGANVPARVWYYVLDYCDHVGYDNVPELQGETSYLRLGELNSKQFWSLFERITKHDIENRLK